MLHAPTGEVGGNTQEGGRTKAPGHRYGIRPDWTDSSEGAAGTETGAGIP